MSDLPWSRKSRRRRAMPSAPGSILAAARQLTATRSRSQYSAQAWQTEAWDLYEQVGELRYVSVSQADTVGRIPTFPAEHLVEGADPEPVESGAVKEIFGVLGGNAERAEIIRNLALQVLVAGTGWLVGIPPDKDSAPGLPPDSSDVRLADLMWVVRSVEDVSNRQGVTRVRMEDGSFREMATEDAWLVRVQRPHPRIADQADSPVRSVLPILREIVQLTKHVSAQVDSRLAGAGLLLVPESIRTDEQSDQPDDGTDGRDGDFVGALIESMVTPIRDRDVASAVVPLVATVPDDVVDKVRHVSFSSALDQVAMQLREEAIRRLALGLDAPPEVLLGMTQANHWSAWQIEESRVRTQIVPLIAMICDALTRELFRPALEAAGVPDSDRYSLWYNPTDLLLRPNRAADAQALHDRGALSEEALRREAGFDESDAPEGMLDRAVEIGLRLVQDSPALFQDPGLPAVIDTIREQLGGSSADDGGGAEVGGSPDVVPSGTDEPQEEV